MGLFNKFFKTKDPLKTLKDELGKLEELKNRWDLNIFDDKIKTLSKKAIVNLKKFLEGKDTVKEVINNTSGIYALYALLKKEISEIEELNLEIEETEQKILEKLKINITQDGKEFTKRIFKINNGFTLKENSLGRPKFPKGFIGLIFIKNSEVYIESHDEKVIFSSDVGENVIKENLKKLNSVKLNKPLAIYFKKEKEDYYVRRSIITISKLNYSQEEIILKDPANSLGGGE